MRPETMLADTAVAVHPDDERYRRLIGETAILPLVGRKLPIIADEYVKIDFGTGALKITPGHDPNDFEIGRRHGLPEISAIGEDGRMTAEAGERFAGLTVAEGQEAVVAALEKEGSDPRPRALHPHRPVQHRSGERIEPLISLQWFMNMDELAAAAPSRPSGTAASRSTPSRSRAATSSGSRTSALVHLPPAVVGPPDPGLVPRRGDLRRHGAARGRGLDARPRRPRHLVLERPVALRHAGLAGGHPELRAFYPTDVLVTAARDIIFLWVARMVMMGIEFTGEVPFSDVYIHSIIQAPDGRRMSKSLGTGIDPLALIDGGPRPPAFAEGGEFPAYGADAVRWGLLAMSSTQDVRFSEEKTAQGAALANKLFNASRFVLLTFRRSEPGPSPRGPRGPLDRLSAPRPSA